MILRCLPPEVLAVDLASLEGSGATAMEVGLPLNTVLNQLPSGKVEMTLQDIIPHMPAGYLKPNEMLTPFLATLVSLPLMDVVMRIPPDLLALRPDQKDVDVSVTNMADPFTEEILREQAEAAKRKAEAAAQAGSQAKIIDENQVPATEEFVPRDQVAATKSFIPPIRPLAGSTIGKTSGLGLGLASLQPPQAPPLPSSGGGRTTVIPPMPGLVRNSSPVPPPAPHSSSRRISPSGLLPTPVRASSPLPMRPPVVLSPVTPSKGADSVPSLAPPFVGAPDRPTAPLPTPLPRIGASAPSPQVPQPPLRPIVAAPPIAVPVVPSAPQAVETEPPMVPSEPVPEQPVQTTEASPAFPLPGQPDPAAAELQRLAALAMQQAEENSLEDSSAVKSGTIAGKAEPAPQAPKESDMSIAAEAPPLPMTPPTPEASSTASLARFVASRSINAPVAINDSVSQPVEGKKESEPAVTASQPALALNLNNCAVSDLVKIPGCSSGLAESIVKHRTKIGSFKKLEDLLEVPGMNNSAYRNLTGEEPPQSSIPLSISELLGFPEEQKITLKDVTDRICCWPDVTGCILGQSTGLSLVGTVPKNLDKAAIVAFAPRMFESINKSFGEITGKETNELIIPTTGTSFHIMRNGDLYLIILSRLPQMPDRHVKIARLVLAGLNLLPA